MVTRSPRKRLLIAAALVLGLLAFAPGTASAQLLDPSTLHIGPVQGNTQDPAQIGSSGLVTVTQVPDKNQATLKEPWLLIIGTTGPTTFTNASITSVTSSSGGSTSWQVGGTNLYGGSWNQSTGLAGTLTANTNQDAYSVVGVQGPLNNSNNWTNWSGQESAINGITTSAFDLYVIQITATLAPQGTVSIQFANGALPNGAYVIAYGQDTAASKAFGTAFTNAGLETGNHITSTPEPSTMVLALSGLVGAGFAGLHRLRRTQPATV